MILAIAGTRPEIIKLAPVLKELDGVKLCVTGQHREMLDQALNTFNLKPDYDLDLMQSIQTPEGYLSAAIPLLALTIKMVNPDWVLVQGDTATTFAGAVAAHLSGVRVAHVEAGLRSFNLKSPFPEEAFRRMVDSISTKHFAPTKGALQNLQDEAISGELIGSTTIDAIDMLDIPHKEAAPFILATAHRRESFGESMNLIAEALITLAKEIPVVIPLHPNPEVSRLSTRLRDGGVTVTSPLDYIQFLSLLKTCAVVLTDSGGLQEEALYLNKPLVIMRDQTEWVDGLNTPAVKLVGTDPYKIANAAKEFLKSPPLVECPYKGGASIKIAKSLCES